MEEIIIIFKITGKMARAPPSCGTNHQSDCPTPVALPSMRSTRGLVRVFSHQCASRKEVSFSSQLGQEGEKSKAVQNEGLLRASRLPCRGVRRTDYLF